MATKKKKSDAAFIKKVVKSVINKNAVLPILEDVYLTDDQLIVSDLETSVVLPFKSGLEVCAPYDRFLDVLELIDDPHFKCDKNFGITVKERGKSREIKFMGDNPENFPRHIVGDEYMHIGDVGEHELGLMKTALRFVSHDDLRPAMTGIYFDQKNIAATDAHRLFWHPYNAFMENFIMPAKAVKVLFNLEGTEWKVFANCGPQRNEDGSIKMQRPTKVIQQVPVTFEHEGVFYRGTLEEATTQYEKRYGWEQDYSFTRWAESNLKEVLDPAREEDVVVPDMDQPEQPVSNALSNVIFLNEAGVMLITRAIDARYPQYEVVIPDENDRVARVVMFPHVLRDELKVAMKFANKSTNQVKFCVNGNVKLHTSDVDFSYEYTNVIDADTFFSYKMQLKDHLRQLKKWIKLKTPVCDRKPAPAFTKEMEIAFNGNFIDEVAALCPDEPFIMGLWSPTKAAIINDHFLIMPLMLNE